MNFLYVSCCGDVFAAARTLFVKRNMLRKGEIDTESRENLLVKCLYRISPCGMKL